MTHVPTGNLLDTDQTAVELGVHPITLVVWRREKRGPPYVTGKDVRLVLYRRADLDKWLASNLVQPENDARRMMRLRANAGTAERVEFEAGATHTKAELAPRRVVKRRVEKPASNGDESKRMAAGRALQQQTRGGK